MAPQLISLKKIWDKANHNAFPDLIRYKNQWFCALREGELHYKGQNGKIRILISSDGENWHSHGLLEEPGVDLRDPKLSIAPNDQLLLLIGGSFYENNKNYIGCQSRVAFSQDGKSWSTFKPILTYHEWLWRLTWNKGIGYGASYSMSDPLDRKKEWYIKLWQTKNAINYERITEWQIEGKPNETTLRFNEEYLIALVRREKKLDKNTWIGRSTYPFKHWQWEIDKKHLGGPNFIVLPDHSMWAAGRIEVNTPYGILEKTALLTLSFNNLKTELILPSGGPDCSYPGMVYYDDILWLTYYSSHEIHSSIYIAKIKL